MTIELFTPIHLRPAPALFVALLCSQPITSDASEVTTYTQGELVPLTTLIRFAPEDWQATVTMTAEAESSNSGKLTSTNEFNESASFVGDIVFFTQEQTKYSESSDAYGAFDLRGQNLTNMKFAARRDGKVLSSEFSVADSFLKKLEVYSPEDAQADKYFRKNGIPHDAIRGYFDERFVHQWGEITTGSLMGDMRPPRELVNLLKICRGKPPKIEIRVAGASADAIVGRFQWAQTNDKGCNVSFGWVKVVDRRSGKPLFSRLQISVIDGETWFKSLSTAEYKYSLPQDIAALATGPSLDRCKVAPRKASPISYPEESKARGEEGTVVLKMVPSSSGRVQSVEVEKSSGFPLLDEWAAADAHGWIFDAGACAGITISIPIDYKISD